MKRWLLALVGLAFIVGALGAAWFANPDAAATGPAWDDDGEGGHSLFLDKVTQVRTARVLESGLGVLPPDAGADDILFLFPTNRPASALELDRVDDFVVAGGTLVVAGDGAHVTAWAERFGHRFHGLPVLLPAGTDATCVTVNVTIAGVPLAPCLPSPTALPPLQNPALAGAATEFHFVANASQAVWLDLNDDGRLGIDDQGPGHYPLAVSWGIGDGRVIAFADGDLFRNHVLQEFPDNQLLAQALVREVAGDLYIDSSGAARDATGRYLMPLYHAGSAPNLLEAIALTLVVVGALAGILAIPYAGAWRAHVPLLDGDPVLEEHALTLIRQSTQGAHGAASPTAGAPGAAQAGTPKDD